MLRVFYGNDAVASRKEAFAAAHDAHAVPLVIDAESYAPGVCREAVGSVSLFGDTPACILDTPSADDAFFAEVDALLEDMQSSAKLFIVIEGPLLAAQKKRYERYAESCSAYTKESSERFNVFGMADALARKDKKSLWLMLQDAKQAGLSGEEIIGTLWWQLKSLRIAAKTKTAAEGGMKDFPYNKAKRSLAAFKEGELSAISRSLLAVYHDGHIGVRDIDLSLERWVLSL